MKAVIFAAGKSTRTYPLTLTRPKPLLTVANQTLLEHQLNALEGTVEAVILVVGYRHEMIRERFGDAYRDTPLEYVLQTDPRGTGHALLQCADMIDGPFLAMNGDDLYAPADLRTLAGHENAVLAAQVEDPSGFGVLVTDDAKRLIRIVEKPPEFVSNLANVGAYAFTPDIFDVLRSVEPSTRGEIEITSAVQALADKGDVTVAQIQGHWLPIGYPWDLLKANAWILDNLLCEDVQGTISPAAHLSGVVSVGQGTVIRPGVVIDGPVCIGDNCSIGPNTWLRPGTSIGNGCKAGQGVEIKNSILMDGSAVPHLSYVGDSVIGEGANLGCGTVTANYRHEGRNHKSMVNNELIDTGCRKFGAIIGDGVHTGINTSIYPGRKIWPGASTLPGEVVQRDIEN